MPGQALKKGWFTMVAFCRVCKSARRLRLKHRTIFFCLFVSLCTVAGSCVEASAADKGGPPARDGGLQTRDGSDLQSPDGVDSTAMQTLADIDGRAGDARETADGGETNAGVKMDAGPATTDADAAPVQPSVSEDASTAEVDGATGFAPGPDASSNGCEVSGIRGWLPPTGVGDAVAIRGGDGFAAAVFDDPDSGRASLNAYDAQGSVIRSIYPSIVYRRGPGSYAVRKVAVAGDVLAVMQACFYKTRCGYTVYVNSGGDFYEGGYGANWFFEFAPDVGEYLEWGGYDDSLLAIAPDDTVVVGTCTRLYPSSMNPIPPRPVLGLARLDPGGNVTTSVLLDLDDRYGYVAGQLEVDEQNRTLVLLDRAAQGSTAGADPIQFQSSVLLFDSDFVQTETWTAPSDVRVVALAPDGNGHVVLVGGRGSGDQARVWLQMLTLPAFAEVWPDARVDGNGEALAIDWTAAGDFVVAGRDEAAGTLWLQRYDETGAPSWSQRAERSGEVETSLPHFPMAVSVQTDGSVFISFVKTAFVYCE